MSWLAWLEAGAYAEFVRVSAYGYAAMITLHSLGLAVMIGLALLLCLRVLGCFEIVPLRSLRRLLPLAWLGFVVNFISGASLFASQATTYVTSPVFLLKMAFVVVGAGLTAMLQDSLSRSEAVGAAARIGHRRALSIAAIVNWTGALIAGRLIAYL